MNQELLDKFNEYINREFYSGYLYYAMSTYFDEVMMEGFSSYMKHNASKELSLAQKMYDYLILRDEKLTFLKIDKPSSDWIDVSDIFSDVLAQEQLLSNEIKDLYLIAKKYDDVGSIEFLKEILSEKTKSLSIARKIIFRIKNTNIVPLKIEFMNTIINKI